MSPVEPIYIAGRLRTASRPSKTWIDSAPYSVFAFAKLYLFSQFKHLALPKRTNRICDQKKLQNPHRMRFFFGGISTPEMAGVSMDRHDCGRSYYVTILTFQVVYP